MKSNACVLSSVRCILSNGISSPVFEASGIEHQNVATLSLGTSRDDRQVRFLQAHDEEGNTVSRIFFMDDAKKDIAAYNPYNYRKRGPLLKLREEEVLIGVYGVIGENGCFTSFGFIVKTWQFENDIE